MDKKLIVQSVWKRPDFFIAFGFGSGLMPYAPGTWGTVAAIPIYLLLMNLSPIVYLVITFLAFLFGVYICARVSAELGVHDFPGIVWDEIVGYLLTMFLAPRGIFWMLLGFGLFRLFDIWKPEPIRWVDKRVHGGLGIMLDDVIAAIPALMMIQILAYVLRHWSL
jgi:phosphatidylglycerophosphatase A